MANAEVAPVLTRTMASQAPKVRRFSARARQAALLAVSFAALWTCDALAGWRDEMKSFRIGMVAADGEQGLSRIRSAFAAALGIPVDIFVARDHASLIEAEAKGRVDYAIGSTAAYAIAAKLCACVEPVVAPLDEDGSVGIAVIIVTRDGRLAGLTDIDKRRIALAPPDSLARTLLPGVALAPEGISFTGNERYLVHTENASAAEALLIEGAVDAIVGWALVPADAEAGLRGGTIERLVEAGMERDALSVVWRSPTLRYGPHVLRAGMDPEVKLLLTGFLTALKARQPDLYALVEHKHGGGFAAVNAADYAVAVDAASRTVAAK